MIIIYILRSHFDLRHVITLVIMSCCVNCGEDHMNDETFEKPHKGLTKIPNNIPANVKKIYLNNNLITEVMGHTFQKHAECTKLRLDYNRLTEIRGDMWIGLKSLKSLFLRDNNIIRVEDSSFSDLPKLEGLYLENNKLTTLSVNTFFPNRPAKLGINLHGNPINWDSALCWLHEAQEEGWITKFNLPEETKDCSNISVTSSKSITKRTTLRQG